MDKELEISKRNGFRSLACENGISGPVLEKDGYVFKLTKRNSFLRAKQDYQELKRMTRDFPGKIVRSFLSECVYKGGIYTCIRQRKIEGVTIKQIGETKFLDFLKANPTDLAFLKKLLEEFFVRIQEKRLYPDIIGYPLDQSIFNALNILLDSKRGLVMCDVGLSPHEDTLKKHGLEFYDSGNVHHYLSRMREAYKMLLKL